MDRMCSFAGQGSVKARGGDINLGEILRPFLQVSLASVLILGNLKRLSHLVRFF